MHADEVATDVGLVRGLLAAQFPEWAGLEIAPVEPSGTDNAIYRLGDEMTVRLPRIPRASAHPAIDHRWLPKLAPLLPLALPVPIALGAPGEGYPWQWSVCAWLEGEPATPDRLTDPKQTAADLGQLIAALHRITFEQGPTPGPDNVFRGTPLAMRDEGTRAAIGLLADAIDIGAVTAVWDEAVRAPEWRNRPLWLHGDLDSRNLLAKDGRLSGVIDWGCLVIGDPACDVSVAWKMLNGQSREVFRSALSIDEATWVRARGWTISQALGALSYYTLETNAVLVREARRWMTEVLADHASTGSGINTGL
jgi:aminoglycoside phosphotransferase (APT) family kinase protein